MVLRMAELADKPQSEELLQQVRTLRFHYLLVLLPAMLVQLAITVAGIGFLSLSYRFLLGIGEPEQSEAG
jgi:hypothetical protein